MKAVFVVAHDSQFKWAAATSKLFRDNGWSVSFFAPSEHADISPAQMADAGVNSSEVTFGDGYSSVGFWATHDVVFFLTPGAISERYIFALRDHIKRDPISRPIIVSAYVGMVISHHLGGYLHRAAADLICVNSPYDYKVYSEAARELGITTSNLVITGLAIIGAEIAPQKSGPIRNVVFADQMAIPSLPEDRQIIYQHLLEYAHNHPTRSVIVKPRHRPRESSFHKGKFPPEKFFLSRPLPNNLRIDYTPISELLPTTDLLLTVSSTAALEAIVQGVRTAIIADAGVRESLGNHIFLGSGLIRTFDQVNTDDIGVPNLQWLSTFQHHGTAPVQAIYEAVCRKVAEKPALIDAPFLAARENAIKCSSGFSRPPVGRQKRDRKKARNLHSLVKAWLPPIALKPARKLARILGFV